VASPTSPKIFVDQSEIQKCVNVLRSNNINNRKDYLNFVKVNHPDKIDQNVTSFSKDLAKDIMSCWVILKNDPRFK
jgi:hypothetical protein